MFKLYHSIIVANMILLHILVSVFSFVTHSEAGDTRLPVWEDQFWADEGALHHT